VVQRIVWRRRRAEFRFPTLKTLKKNADRRELKKACTRKGLGDDCADFDVSVVGELNLDLILSGLPPAIELDREHLAKDLTITLGSSSAIFAHNLALLGNRVGFSSAIGSDRLGEICLERLGESGVDLSRVRKFAGKLTGLTVILPQQTKRYILTYPGTMFEMKFEDLDLEYIFFGETLHLSSYFLQRALRPRISELFREAKRAGLTTSLDTNDDPEDEWALDLLQVLPYVDVLLPNDQEACRMARKNDPDEGGGLSGDESCPGGD